MIKKELILERMYTKDYEYTVKTIETIKVYIFGICVYVHTEDITNNNDNDIFKKSGKTVGFINK